MTSTTELLLIRHALPVSGEPDPGLSPAGQEQSLLLAERLASTPVDVIATSGLRRAVETAAPLATRKNLATVTVPDLREWDPDPETGGKYVAFEDRASGDPRLLALREGRLAEVMPPWVDAAAFQKRVVAAVEGVVASAGAGSRIAVVSHGGAINAYLAHLIGAELMFWFLPGYTSISTVDVLPSGNAVVRSVNDTHHLGS
jgi:2,3-bisphosphoglycerate-dependent phosphoglycerate mutase